MRPQVYVTGLHAFKLAALNACRRIVERADSGDEADIAESFRKVVMSRIPVRLASSGTSKKAGAAGELALMIGLAVPAAKPEAHDPANLERRFHPTRKWRFDMSFPSRKIAIEIDGGLFSGHKSSDVADWLEKSGRPLTKGDVKALRQRGGRHNQAAGRREDMIKDNEAIALGWVVIHVLPEWIPSGEALRYFEAAWHARG